MDAVLTDVIHYENRKLVYYHGNLTHFVATHPVRCATISDCVIVNDMYALVGGSLLLRAGRVHLELQVPHPGKTGRHQFHHQVRAATY